MRNSIYLMVGILFSFIQAHAVASAMRESRSVLRDRMNAQEIQNARLRISQARYADDRAYLLGEKQNLTREAVLENLRPGDIVLVRSGNLLGSMAARASDVPGQFAHLIFISQDPQSGELKTIESDQGIGVVVSSPSESITGGVVRMALFRHKDLALAERASQALWQYVSEKMKNGGHIAYDNHLDGEDHSALYCTEVATLAFDLVGEKVPATFSHAAFLDEKLQKSLAIPSSRIFTPQDLEIDPRFELVLEWRNIPQLQNVYKKDALFGKYFEWIKEKKVSLRPSPAGHLIGFIGNQFFSEKLEKATGTSDKTQMANYIKYAFELYTALSRYEQLLDLEVKAKDTRNFSVQDYENLLEVVLADQKAKARGENASY